jgi:hypothetical protein
MGWSLGGILAGAGKGMADWAGREIVAEKQAEAATAQFERQKELALMQDELAGKREERSLELKDKFANKAAMAKKESQASAFESLDWAATTDPDGPKLKARSPEYYRFMGEKLDASGEPELAKQMFANADKFDDNSREDRKLAAQLAAIGESRNARTSAAEMAAAEKRYAIEAKQIESLGTFRTKATDPDTGKPVVHEESSGTASLLNIYQKTNGNMDIVAESAAGGRSLMESNPKKYPNLGSAITIYYDGKIAERKAAAAKKN